MSKVAIVTGGGRGIGAVTHLVNNAAQLMK